MPAIPLDPNTRRFLIGRDEGLRRISGGATPVVLEGDRVSRTHLEISLNAAEQWTATDLGSTNGSFLIGRAGRMSPQEATLLPPDQASRFFVGGFLLTFSPLGESNSGQPDLQIMDLKDGALLEVKGVTVEKQEKGNTFRILQNVSFTAFPRRVMAIMGGSGTGKSTLLKAINGYEPPTQGEVSLNERNLYGDISLRQTIGYLPQEDIFHEVLTIPEVLEFTSKIRNPALSADERARRVNQAIADVALQGPAAKGVPSRKLSGGQKKRLGIAMELLCNPKVLFLDEPTSGLSSEDSYDLLQTLQGIARAHGTTIIMVIHQPSLDAYKLIDDLVVLKKDKDTPAELIYAGPAFPQAIQHFLQGLDPIKVKERYGDNPGPDVILQSTEGNKSKGSLEWGLASWRQAWSRSGLEALHVPVPTTIENKRLPPLRPFGSGQFFTLLHRNFQIKFRDHKNLMLVVLQPLIIGCAMALALGKFDQVYSTKIWNHHFFMMFSALWCGASNPPNEIVGEWKIYYRERMVNLKIPSYSFSKLATYAVLSLVQSVILGICLGIGWDLHIPMWLLIAALWSIAVAGNVLGLLISVAAPTADVAVSLVPIPLVLMLLFAGGPIKRLPDMATPAHVISHLTLSRWGFESLVHLEADAWGDEGRGWHREFFDIKTNWGEKDGIPTRQDTERGATLGAARTATSVWTLCLLLMSLVLLKRRSEKPL